jgi:sugar lactone lactonase YvrE
MLSSQLPRRFLFLTFTLALTVMAPARARAENHDAYRIFTVKEGLYLPTDVKMDRGGNLYFCDWSARIFRLDAWTGVVTVVAGTGTAGDSGDGGPAVDATLGGPGALALDAAGNIYFSDPNNHRVRKITKATGIIDTVAGNGTVFDGGDGGPAVEAGIPDPSGIAVDRHGNLYIADGGARVRLVTASTGIITTYAGTWNSGHAGDGGAADEAQIDQPSDVALDVRGNLYIAARGEHRIRKVTAATGIITTIAGNSTGVDSGIFGIIVFQGGFSGDGGPATSALLNDPEEIALDAEGNVYISDTLNHRIRRVDAESGIIETIAGTGVQGYSGDRGAALRAEISDPAGILIDAMNRIFFADEENSAIRELFPMQFRPRRPVSRFGGAR